MGPQGAPLGHHPASTSELPTGAGLTARLWALPGPSRGTAPPVTAGTAAHRAGWKAFAALHRARQSPPGALPPCPAWGCPRAPPRPAGHRSWHPAPSCLEGTEGSSPTDTSRARPLLHSLQNVTTPTKPQRLNFRSRKNRKGQLRLGGKRQPGGVPPAPHLLRCPPRASLPLPERSPGPLTCPPPQQPNPWAQGRQPTGDGLQPAKVVTEQPNRG